MNKRIATVIGDNIRAERSRKRLSQEELGYRCGMQTTQIARMERAETEAGISKYVRIAWALEIPPATLLHGLDDPAPLA